MHVGFPVRLCVKRISITFTFAFTSKRKCSRGAYT